MIDIESEQQRVASLEDFDAADKLNEVIDDMKQQILDFSNKIVFMKAAVSNLEEQKLLNRKKQVS